MIDRGEYVERKAGPDDAGRRLDRVLRALLPRHSLSAIYAALRRGFVRVNGGKSVPDYRLAPGDILSLAPGLAEALPSPLPHADRDRLELLQDILVLATENLLFLNKPRGILVHGPGSLEELVRAALGGRSSASLSFVPGPLHRLDRNTSGLVTFPRDAAGARAFTALLRARLVRKRYLALLEGRLSGQEEWADNLVRDDELRVSRVHDEKGNAALSRVLPLAVAGDFSLALIEIRTGLTHQIRAQAAARGMPLAGDAKYGGLRLAGGYILHALSLEFPEPPFPDLPSRVVAPLPSSAFAHLGAIFGAAAVKSSLEKVPEA